MEALEERKPLVEMILRYLTHSQDRASVKEGGCWYFPGAVGVFSLLHCG